MCFMPETKFFFLSRNSRFLPEFRQFFIMAYRINKFVPLKTCYFTSRWDNFYQNFSAPANLPIFNFSVTI
jgi:hypothetical protein